MQLPAVIFLDWVNSGGQWWSHSLIGWSGFEALELQGSTSNLIRKYLVLIGGEVRA